MNTSWTWHNIFFLGLADYRVHLFDAWHTSFSVSFFRVPLLSVGPFLLVHWQYCKGFGASLDPSCSLSSLQLFFHIFILSSYLRSLLSLLVYHHLLSAYREDILQYNWLMDNIFHIKGGRNALTEFCTITFGIIYFVRLLNWTALNLW